MHGQHCGAGAASAASNRVLREPFALVSLDSDVDSNQPKLDICASRVSPSEEEGSFLFFISFFYPWCEVLGG
jgi:hypothetical protein